MIYESKNFHERNFRKTVIGMLQSIINQRKNISRTKKNRSVEGKLKYIENDRHKVIISLFIKRNLIISFSIIQLTFLYVVHINRTYRTEVIIILLS